MSRRQLTAPPARSQPRKKATTHWLMWPIIWLVAPDRGPLAFPSSMRRSADVEWESRRRIRKRGRMRWLCLHDDISFALTFQNETLQYSVWRESAKTSTSKWCVSPSATSSAACKPMACQRNISSRSDGVALQTLASVNDFKMIRWCFSRRTRTSCSVRRVAPSSSCRA